MKTAFLEESLKITIGEASKPGFTDDEVLIRVRSCGVCATDVKKFTGKRPSPHFPFILGHEPAGTVAEVGARVKSDLKTRDRVAVAPVIVCGHCHGCTSGLLEVEGMGICENSHVIGYHGDGAFTEYISVPPENVFKIPDNLSFRDAAIIEPVAACANGVFRAIKAPPGKAVVLGAGFMGLTCLALLKMLGAQVLIADILDERLETARKLGADKVVNSKERDLEEEVKHFTEGWGADSVICAVGIKELTESGIRMLGKAGKLILLASGAQGTKIEFDLNETHYFCPVITGASSYTNGLFLWTIDILARKLIDTDTLITHSGGLEDVEKFLEMTRDLEGLKKVILLGED